MGYYSDYTIKSVSPIERKEAVVSYLQDVLEVEFDNDFRGEMKWYDYEEDLSRLASAFPDVRFEIERVGEEHPDAELIIGKNGKLKCFRGVVRYDVDDEFRP